MKIPKTLTKASINAHSWLGLLAGALMYVVCLSGTIAVVIPELERWEQPYAQEFSEVDVNAVDDTFNALLQSGIDVTEHMYVVLPTGNVPRARIASETESWFLNADGSLGEKERNAWSEMMLDLHLYLHLPHSWGMIIVSMLGALLVALIFSGLFAHRRILRDAFKYRSRASRSVQQLDLHNRLSVWATPFHLMIAVTGAYFGLALPFLGVASQALFEGDNQQVLEAVFGEEPALTQNVSRIGIAEALNHVSTYAPDTTPIFATIHDAGEPGAYISVAATHPQRLIYSENYLYDAHGSYLQKTGFSDGETGQQVVYSIYRLHFGYFGGVPVRLAYVMMGLALVVVSVTGINVWLARRRKVDAINDLWTGFVWGLPLAILVSATSQIVTGIPSTGIVWAVTFVACSYAAYRRDPRKSKRHLLLAIAIAAVALGVLHILRFPEGALQGFPLLVNSILVSSGCVLLVSVFRLAVPQISRKTPLQQN